MPKQCSHQDCSYNVFSKGMCKAHWMMWRYSERDEKVAKKPLIRPRVNDEMVRKTIRVIHIKKRPRSIKKVSDKQSKRLAKYRVERDKYLSVNKVCQYPNCSNTDVDLHHAAGRVGDLLFNPKYFVSLCRKHHIMIEQSPLLAKELKLSASRLNK